MKSKILVCAVVLSGILVFSQRVNEVNADQTEITSQSTQKTNESVEKNEIVENSIALLNTNKNYKLYSNPGYQNNIDVANDYSGQAVSLISEYIDPSNNQVWDKIMPSDDKIYWVKKESISIPHAESKYGEKGDSLVCVNKKIKFAFNGLDLTKDIWKGVPNSSIYPFRGNTVHVCEEYVDPDYPSIKRSLIVFPNGGSTWTDPEALEDTYQVNAKNQDGQKTVDGLAIVSNKKTSPLYLIPSEKSEMVGNSVSYKNQAYKVLAEYKDSNTNQVWNKIQTQDTSSYWIKNESLVTPHAESKIGERGVTAVDYDKKVKYAFNGLDLTKDIWKGVPNSTMFLFYGDTVHVSEEYVDPDFSSIKRSLITFPNGGSTWTDPAALEDVDTGMNKDKETYQISNFKTDYSNPEYYKDYVNGGTRIYSIKTTDQDYPLYSDSKLQNITGQSSNKMSGTFVLASKKEVVKHTNGSQETYIYISSDNKNWYWINEKALSYGPDGYKTAYQGLIGSGQNGAIKWYVSPTDPLKNEVQDAVNEWNKKIPNLFESTPLSSSTDSNLSFTEGALSYGVWAEFQSGYFYPIDSNKKEIEGKRTRNPNVKLTLSNQGESNLVNNGSKDELGTRNIIMHEIGHALGLGHSGGYNGQGNLDSYTFEKPNNLMFESSDGTSNSFNYVSQGQVNVIKLIREMNWTFVGKSETNDSNVSVRSFIRRDKKDTNIRNGWNNIN